MDIDTGISKEDRETIAGELAKVLADTYTLYMKTHAFHWNITGPMFNSLHNMFEEQYTALWQATDEIAERIRALGVMAPGSYSQFGQLSSIKEEHGVPSDKEMIKQLVEGNEAVVKTLRNAKRAVQEGGDDVSDDLLNVRLEYHEKTAWMLRSLLA